MQLFLHKCLTLVRSTGIEPKTESLKAFIYKGFSDLVLGSNPPLPTTIGKV